jgi:thiosulfate dehydrogenase [quinone] large subunit
MTRREQTTQLRTLKDPARLRSLTSETRFAWGWLVVRVYLGWDWLLDGWAKLQSPTWMSGAQLREVWLRSTETGSVAGSTHGWYRTVLQFLLDRGSEAWLGKTIAVSETLLGIAMILGLLTAMAAVSGSLLGVNAAVVGAGLANPLTVGLAFMLVLSWKTAGWIGFDRWLLPLLGAPWESGSMVHRGGSTSGVPAFQVEVTK